MFRSRRSCAHRRRQSSVNAVSRLARELLRDDCAQHHLERIASFPHLVGAHAIDERRQHRVGAAQMLDRSLEIERRARGGWSSHAPTLSARVTPVSYTHLRAHETPEHLVCRLLLEKKK